MRRHLLSALLLWCLTLTGLAQSPSGAIAQVNARSEIAAALYAAAATQAAAERVADQKLRAQRNEIERLRTHVRVAQTETANLKTTLNAETAKLRATLSTAQENYVVELAARDRAYAQEIAVFRAAVVDIAAL